MNVVVGDGLLGDQLEEQDSEAVHVGFRVVLLPGVHLRRHVQQRADAAGEVERHVADAVLEHFWGGEPWGDGFLTADCVAHLSVKRQRYVA